MKLIIAATLLSLSQAQAAKVFVYCSEGSPSSFSPALVTDGTSFNAGAKTLYNRIVEFERGTTNLVPALAKSWKISKDGLTYEFKLRSDVQFHTTSFFKPTRNFNADDVIFSYDRQRLDKHPFHKVGGGSYEYFDSMEMGKIIKDIKKTDDYTLVITLSQPEAPFLANLAMDFASIYSAEYAAQLQKSGKLDQIDQKPVGTGPFILQDYVKDNSIRYTANPTYFQGKAAIEKLVFAITPDPSVRLQKLKTGECHLATEPAPADLEAIKKDANLALISQPGLNVAYLAFNVQKKPFDNVMVRQAIHHALNRASYINAIYLGNAAVAKNPMPPTIWGYNKGLKDYDYNVEKAKELLKKAGFEKGFSMELWTMPVSRPYLPGGKKMGELMQADLAKVGITAKLVSYDWPTYLAKSKNGEHQAIQFGWTGDNGDPDNFLYVNLACSAIEPGANRARWCNKDFDELLLKAKRSTNKAERTGHYMKAQELFKKDAPWVTLAHSTVYRAMSKKVTGFKIDPLGNDAFYGVDLK